ncbi:glycosyltransferase family 2 protein [Planctomycetota bacterium]|nr:glycosyltransferase family 2 protein [Planctomycetota bacterium]
MSILQTTIQPKHEPLVSVLMPVFNTDKYLAAAIESILDQTYSNLELICLNDGSTDKSLDIMRGYALCDSRIRVYTQENAGLVPARNRTLELANGKYAALMDSDDISASERLQKQVDFMESHYDHVAVGSYAERTDPYGSPAGITEPPLTHDEIDTALLSGDGSALSQPTMLIRTEAFKSINGWSDQFNFVEDLDMQLRLAEVGKLANIAEPLFTYRRHMDSFCFRNYQTMTTQIADIINAAYKRRGINDTVSLEQVRPDLKEKHNPAEIYRNWACHAIHNHNRKIAYKHAFNAIRKEPFNIKSWQVAYWSLSA